MTRARTPPDVNQARRCLQAGNLDEAERISRQLLKRNRKDVNALQLLGSIATTRGAYVDAAEYYRTCVRLNPTAAGLHFLYGKACSMLGRYEEAIAGYDEALRLKPDDRLCAGWKAGALERLEKYDQARDVLQPFVDAGTDDADIAELLARIDVHTADYQAAITLTERHLQKTDTTPSQAVLLNQVKGRAHQKLGQHDLAFESFQRANEASDSRPFDADAHIRLIDDLIETFSANEITKMVRGTDRSTRPVFIAGMPRSGTTLAEQIIDAHPDAHGAGEIEDLEQFAAGLQVKLNAYDPYPVCLTELTQAGADALAGSYLKHIADLGGRATRVVNKSLENYKHLGLVALLFPGAKIIHCRRHPLDTCLSCYMGGILPARAPFVTDLRHLGLAYRQYERVMRHWQAVLDIPILEIVYEDLVNDLEGQSRRMIDFLDLDWDERCLRYYESGRSVLTLSYAQVNKPIYKSAVARYRHYEQHLGPLKAALSETC
jgi:tetratricopeptide (TPR) repeat protein